MCKIDKYICYALQIIHPVQIMQKKKHLCKNILQSLIIHMYTFYIFYMMQHHTIFKSLYILLRMTLLHKPRYFESISLYISLEVF